MIIRLDIHPNAQESNATTFESDESIIQSGRSTEHTIPVLYESPFEFISPAPSPIIQNPTGDSQARQLPQTNLPTEHRQPLRNKIRPIKHRRVPTRQPCQVCSHHAQHPIAIKHGKYRKCCKGPPQAGESVSCPTRCIFPIECST